MGWHKGERVTVIGGSIGAALSLWVFLALGSSSMNFSTLRSVTGLPLAADFANYWAASKLALAGKAALAYNINELGAVEQQFLGTHHHYGCGWFYPPFALFWALPLGLMPYLTSLLVWTVVPLAIYAIVFRRVSHYAMSLVLFLCFPGTLLNVLFGQNGFISGIFLGGGLLLLDYFPLGAGCLFGLLCYKPPLAVLVLVALIFGRYWKTSTAALVTLSLLAGAARWRSGIRPGWPTSRCKHSPCICWNWGRPIGVSCPPVSRPCCPPAPESGRLTWSKARSCWPSWPRWPGSGAHGFPCLSGGGPGPGNPVIHSLRLCLRPRPAGPAAGLALGRRPPARPLAGRTAAFMVRLAYALCRDISVE